MNWKVWMGVAALVVLSPLSSWAQVEDSRIPDRNASRSFVGGTARAVPQGKGYLASQEIFFTFAAYGVTEHFTAAGGITIVPASEIQFYYVAPKLSFRVAEDKSVAVGVLAGGLTSRSEFAGILYGMGTFGSPDHAFTTGVGFGFAGSEISGTPILHFGYERRISDSFKFISENYTAAIEEPWFLVSGGLRHLSERFTFDVAVFTIPELVTSGGFPFLPYIGFAWHFPG